MKYVTTATAIALLAGVVIGIANFSKIPVVYSLAKKLPGSTPAAA